jgi:hypothetical protein
MKWRITAITASILGCVVLAGMIWWNFKLQRENAELRSRLDPLPVAKQVTPEETESLAPADSEYWDKRSARENTEAYAMNLRLWELRKQRQKMSTNPYFTKASGPVLKEWVRRNAHLLWAEMVDNAWELGYQTKGSQNHEIDRVDCKWTYRSEQLSETSWHIHENSLTVTMTMKLKQSVIDEERKWPADMRWPLPPRTVTVTFTIDGKGVRDLSIQGLDAKRMHRADESLRMHEEAGEVLRFIFTTSHRLRWATIEWDEVNKKARWVVVD